MAESAEDLANPAGLPEHVLSRCEAIPVTICPDAEAAARDVAAEITRLIHQRNQRQQPTVLGLCAGSSVTGVYHQLTRQHRQHGLSFQRVVVFNLDEYYPIEPDAAQSHGRFLRHHLLDHVDIRPENVHLPDPTLPVEAIPAHCHAFEQRIADAGGIDLQLLGVGRTGHIGLNEPGSGPESRTRLISLDRVTRMAAAGDFFGEANVPRRAITMGVGTILEASRIRLLAFGEHKAGIIQQAVEGSVSPHVAASQLRGHPAAQIVLDPEAAGELTRCKRPWQLGPIRWDEARIRDAVIWLALRQKKPLLKLTDEDYNEAGLQDLLAEHGPAHEINVEVFRHVQRTITGWPGGKPAHRRRPGDIRKPFDDIHPKRVLVFSPHPDDDVISMGGTLMRLVDHEHEVHVAYQTSGNIAVSDDDALRFADFAAEFNAGFGIDRQQTPEKIQQLEDFLNAKAPGEPDSPAVRELKGLIRRGEARAAGRFCRIPLKRLHFLNLPFYETGGVEKRPVGPEDTRIITDLLHRIQPHQIYAAGDLSDPHGTHRVCLHAILHAWTACQDQPWRDQCEFWLYRGAWMEWEPARIDMAVPLSPHELHRKRHAIFKHESQKDKALFPGTDPREFWQRAEDRNRTTANLYDQLGMPEYEAIEGFVRHG